MEPVKTNSLTKKSLKVAINKPALVSAEEPIIESIPESAEPEDVSIQASKATKLTKKGKLDTRGKQDITLANLEKGRQRLKQLWDEKRKAKELLMDAAVEKKIKQSLMQKKIIEEALGVDDIETDGEEVYAPDPKPSPKAKKQSKVVHAVASAPPPPPSPPPIKAPKKKTIKYVEVSSSEEEEEEIVYVKRQPATKKQKPQVVYQEEEPKVKPSQKQNPFSQIVFY